MFFGPNVAPCIAWRLLVMSELAAVLHRSLVSIFRNARSGHNTMSSYPRPHLMTTQMRWHCVEINLVRVADSANNTIFLWTLNWLFPKPQQSALEVCSATIFFTFIEFDVEFQASDKPKTSQMLVSYYLRLLSCRNAEPRSASRLLRASRAGSSR